MLKGDFLRLQAAPTAIYPLSIYPHEGAHLRKSPFSIETYSVLYILHNN